MKKATKAERDYMGRVASLGCLICGDEAEIHHIRRYGEKRKHSQIVPLCPMHHRGAAGVHHWGKKRWESMYKLTHDEMLAKVEGSLT